MSERIMTLFGEEIVPEQPKPAAKTRAKKKPGEEQAEESPSAENEREETPAEQHNPIAETIAETPTAHEATANHAGETAEEIKIPVEAIAETVSQAEIIDVEEIARPLEPIIDTVSQPETTPITDAAAETPAEPAKKKRAKVNEENIILPEDWQGDKKYYTIGEVADLFKVKTSHIRFWTNEFKLKVRTTRKGDRLFTPEQIRELRAIHHLVKERGFTLTGAKGKLKEQNNRDVQTIDLKQSLIQLRSKLIIIKNQLK